jgi:D-alanyl-D-alanine carboxypeptidase
MRNLSFAVVLVLIFASTCGNPGFASGKSLSQDQVAKVLANSGIAPEIRAVIMSRIKAKPDHFSALLDAVEAVRKIDPFLLTRVDKTVGLSDSYVPEDLVSLDGTGIIVSRKGHHLRKVAFDALKIMDKAARTEGITLMVSSAYRSYAYQKEVFERTVKEMGLKEAERVSAHPGMSQHQLGTAIDFGSITDAFAETKAGKWLYSNASRYGFSLSYPKGFEQVTGYVWESWHYRYIGVDAVELQDEFFGGVQQYLILFLDGWKNNRS